MMLERRGWLRFTFSLQTLFVLVTVVACWLGYEIPIVRQRSAALQWLEQQRAVPAQIVYLTDGEWPRLDLPYLQDARRAGPIPLVRRLLGDEQQDLLVLPDECTREQLTWLADTFPEAMLFCFNRDSADLK